MKKGFTAYDIIVSFISLISYLIDVGSDIVLVILFFTEGHPVWGALSMTFVALATFLMQIFSFVWHATDGTLTWKKFVIHVLFLAPLHRYYDVLRLGLKARRTRSKGDLDTVYRANNDICLLRLMECFAESTPQLILQLYIILKFGHFNWILGVSTAFSLTSVAWAMTAYTDGLRLAFKDDYRRKWLSMTVYTLCQIALVASRVVAIVVFTTVFQAWIFLPMGIHWFLMTFWVTLQDAEFGQTPWEKRLFNAVSGLIYIFCFLNLKDGHARWRLLAYHMVILAESSLFVLLWFLYRPENTPVWLTITTLVTVFGGFALGGILMITYYSGCHPTGIHGPIEKKETAFWFKRMKYLQDKPMEQIFDRSPSSSRVAEWLHASMNLSSDDRGQEVNFDTNPESGEIPDILSSGMLDNSNNMIFSCSTTYYQFKEPSLPSASMIQDWNHTLDSAKNSHFSASSSRQLISPSPCESKESDLFHVNRGYTISPARQTESFNQHESKLEHSERCSSVDGSHISTNSERTFALTGVCEGSLLPSQQESSTNKTGQESLTSYTSREISPLDVKKLWEESQNRLKIHEDLRLSKSVLFPSLHTGHDSFYSSPEFRGKELSIVEPDTLDLSDNLKIVKKDYETYSTEQKLKLHGSYNPSEFSSSLSTEESKYDKGDITDTFFSESSVLESSSSKYHNSNTDISISCLNLEAQQMESLQNLNVTHEQVVPDFNRLDDLSLSLFYQRQDEQFSKNYEPSGLSNFFGDISAVNQTDAGRSRFWSSSISAVIDNSELKSDLLSVVTPHHNGSQNASRFPLNASYYQESNAQSPYSPSSQGNPICSLYKTRLKQSPNSSEETSSWTNGNMAESVLQGSSYSSANFDAHSGLSFGQDSNPHRSDSGLMAGSISSRRNTSSSDHASPFSGINTDDSGYSVAQTNPSVKGFKLKEFRFASDSRYPSATCIYRPRVNSVRSKSLSSLSVPKSYGDRLPSKSRHLPHALSTPYLHKNNQELLQKSDYHENVINDWSSSRQNGCGASTISTQSNIPELSYVLSGEESMVSEKSRQSLLSRKAIADTPWRSDYCENPSTEYYQDVDLYGSDYQSLDQANSLKLNQIEFPPSQTTKPRLDISSSSSKKRTPIRLNTLDNSPQRFGRNVDLFNREIWQSSSEDKRRASSHAYFAFNQDLMANEINTLTHLTESPYKFRTRKSCPMIEHSNKSAFYVPVKTERRKSDMDKEKSGNSNLNHDVNVTNNDLVLMLSESPYKFRSHDISAIDKHSSAEQNEMPSVGIDKENKSPHYRNKEKRRSKRRLSSPCLVRKDYQNIGEMKHNRVGKSANHDNEAKTLTKNVGKNNVEDMFNPCYMYSDTDSEDNSVLDRLSDVTCSSSMSSLDVQPSNRYFTFSPKSAEGKYSKDFKSNNYIPTRPALKSLENTPRFSPIQVPDIIGGSKIKEKKSIKPVSSSTPKIGTGGIQLESSNAGTFVILSIQNEDSTVQV